MPPNEIPIRKRIVDVVAGDWVLLGNKVYLVDWNKAGRPCFKYLGTHGREKGYKKFNFEWRYSI